MAANQFNPALGTLEAVNITLVSDIHAALALENLGETSGSINLTEIAGITLTLPGTIGIVTGAPSISVSKNLAAFDGAIDFGGISGANITGLTGTAQTSQSFAADTSFVGTGTVALAIAATSPSTLTGPADLAAELLTDAGATIEVSYTYIPAATPPATASSDAPIITGTEAGQRVTDQTTVAPFANVVITDSNVDQTETVTVTPSALATGMMSNLGGGSYDPTTGVYRDIGSAAAVTAALRGLVFTPADIAPGQTVTTGFTISDTDTSGVTTRDSATSVSNTAGVTIDAAAASAGIKAELNALAVAPTISGTVANQAVVSTGTIAPFASVSIAEHNPAQTEAVTIRLSAASNGSLTNLGGGSYDAAAGIYTDSGSAASVISALRGLVFTPNAAAIAAGHAVTTGFTISDTDTAGASATNSTTTVVASAPGSVPNSSPATQFAITDTTSNASSSAAGTAYSGPVAGLEWEYITTTTDSLNIAATAPNTFIHTGSGNDALDVSRVNGNNVLDGGTGSNFLVGGSGDDTFFVDDRGPAADIWDTVTNFHSGDAATIWGVTPSDFTLTWVDGQGATGYTGLTLHATAPGAPTVSLTLAGLTTADLTNGSQTISYGTTATFGGVPGSTYMYIHAN